MARAFSAPRSNSARAAPLCSLWDKETIVTGREHHHPQLREIQSTFEPSRLSLSWLAQAYEQVVPLVRRTTSRPSRRPLRMLKSCGGARPRGPLLAEASANIMGRGVHEPEAASPKDRPLENGSRTSWPIGDSTLCIGRSVSLCIPSKPLYTLEYPLSNKLKPTPLPARSLPYASAPRLMSLSSQHPWSFWTTATV